MADAEFYITDNPASLAPWLTICFISFDLLLQGFWTKIKAVGMRGTVSGSIETSGGLQCVGCASGSATVRYGI